MINKDVDQILDHLQEFKESLDKIICQFDVELNIKTSSKADLFKKDSYDSLNNSIAFSDTDNKETQNSDGINTLRDSRTYNINENFSEIEKIRKKLRDQFKGTSETIRIVNHVKEELEKNDRNKLYQVIDQDGNLIETNDASKYYDEEISGLKKQLYEADNMIMLLQEKSDNHIDDKEILEQKVQANSKSLGNIEVENMELLKEVDKRKKVEADLITERDYWHKKTEQTTFDLKVAQQRLEKVEKKENKISKDFEILSIKHNELKNRNNDLEDIIANEKFELAELLKEERQKHKKEIGNMLDEKHLIKNLKDEHNDFCGDKKESGTEKKTEFVLAVTSKQIGSNKIDEKADAELYQSELMNPGGIESCGQMQGLTLGDQMQGSNLGDQMQGLTLGDQMEENIWNQFHKEENSDQQESVKKLKTIDSEYQRDSSSYMRDDTDGHNWGYNNLDDNSDHSRIGSPRKYTDMANQIMQQDDEPKPKKQKNDHESSNKDHLRKSEPNIPIKALKLDVLTSQEMIVVKENTSRSKKITKKNEMLNKYMTNPNNIISGITRKSNTNKNKRNIAQALHIDQEETHIEHIQPKNNNLIKPLAIGKMVGKENKKDKKAEPIKRYIKNPINYLYGEEKSDHNSNYSGYDFQANDSIEIEINEGFKGITEESKFKIQKSQNFIEQDRDNYRTEKSVGNADPDNKKLSERPGKDFYKKIRHSRKNTDPNTVVENGLTGRDLQDSLPDFETLKKEMLQNKTKDSKGLVEEKALDKNIEAENLNYCHKLGCKIC